MKVLYELKVFIIELISNGSDALEKLQHKMITAGGETAPMEMCQRRFHHPGTLSSYNTFIMALRGAQEQIKELLLLSNLLFNLFMI
ncbi:hypothetical protein QQF64_025699 [Cirrhinus molitorella]|uniref:Uncharacterized protein n=1 Tax=Cirrhinus molitorella TaxID=172907 RepID=A0ABR3NPS9_9TELE